MGSDLLALSNQSMLSVSLDSWAIPFALNLGGVADWALLFGKTTADICNPTEQEDVY